MPQITEAQTQQLIRLKTHFPYRICFGAIKGEEFYAYAKTDKRTMNKLLRTGWTIYEAK